MKNTSRVTKVKWLSDAIEDFFIEYPDAHLDKRKILSQFGLRFGSTWRTGVEILKMLESVKLIHIDKNNITLVKEDLK